jgi:hypothetical protein
MKCFAQSHHPVQPDILPAEILALGLSIFTQIPNVATQAPERTPQIAVDQACPYEVTILKRHFKRGETRSCYSVLFGEFGKMQECL